MIPSSRARFAIPPNLRYPLAAFAIGWIAIVLGGGSSRADALQLVPLRVTTAFALGVILFFTPPAMLRSVRLPLLFLVTTAVLVALQLVPLPYWAWSNLPGRELYAEVVQKAAVGDIWHPLSLSPDLTWNSLLALLAPALFVLCTAILSTEWRRLALMVLLGTILLSGFLGLVQVGAGPATSLRFYQITNLDSGVGLFANRNHQAVFLAMGIPIAGWLGTRINDKGVSSIRLVLAGSAILFLLACIFASQSRTGSALAILSIVLTGTMLLSTGRLVFKWIVLSALGAMFAVFALAAVALRQWSDSRLDQLGINNDLRFVIFPETVDAIRTFFPVGAGFGTFPQVFPRFETLEDLRPEYFNHTHIEPSQLLIEGGVPAALLALAFLGWYVFVTWLAWRKAPSSNKSMQARLCTILVALPLLGSLTDYPLRTPLMLCTFAFSATLLHLLVRGLESESGHQALDGKNPPS